MIFSENSTVMNNGTAFNTGGEDLSCRQSTLSSYVAQAVFLILVAIITLLGNISVCLTVFLNCNLHSLTSYLVVSLAISDLMVGTFSLPFRIHQTLHNTTWCLSEEACMFWIWADLLCCCASIGNLALISIDRFLATKYPLRYHQMITKNTSWAMLSSVWIYSFIVASSGITNWTTSNGPSVRINKGCYKPDPYFYVFAASVGFFFPLTIILCAYSYILKVAMRHFRTISRLTVPILQKTKEKSGEKQQPENSEQFKATKTLAIVVGVFVICWLPTFIILLVHSWCRTCLNNQLNPKLKSFFNFINITFVYTLPNVNSALNPFIYVAFSKDLRKAFVKTFKIVLKCL